MLEPHFGTCDGPNSVLQNAADWAFKDITISKGLVSQLDLTTAASYAHNYTVNGHFGTFEAGFKISNAHKTQDSTETVYDGWSTKAASAIALMTTLESGFDNTNYFNGDYFGGNFGPVSDFNKVADLYSRQLRGDVDPYKTATDTWPNIFHTIERIPAGYAMNTIDFGKLHLQTGLRFEATQMDTFGYWLTCTKDQRIGRNWNHRTRSLPGSTITKTNCWNRQRRSPTTLPTSTFYPACNCAMGLDANSDLRAVIARGVARPDPYQLVPYITSGRYRQSPARLLQAIQASRPSTPITMTCFTSAI